MEKFQLKHTALIVLLSLLSLGCAKQINTTIADSKWTLAEWPDREMPSSAKATLLFAKDKQVSGKAFCNNYGGSANVNGNKIHFSQMFSTKMFCQDLAEAEDLYLADLSKVNTFKIEGDKLMLYHQNKLLMVFKKTN